MEKVEVDLSTGLILFISCLACILVFLIILGTNQITEAIKNNQCQCEIEESNDI